MNASVLEEEKLILNYSDIELQELISVITEDIKTNYSAKEIDFIVNCKEHKIRGDELQITTALCNVLDNAAKYSREKSCITINVVNDDKYSIISVEDNGPGIAEGDLKNIFEKFFRASSSKSLPVKGLGLGLYFVKKIIDTHQGKIEVHSKVGKGTTFKIFIPR